MKTIKIAMMLFMMVILSGCSEDKNEDDGKVVSSWYYWCLWHLNSAWVNCAWEELVEYIDADGKKVKIINRFRSVPADEESISLLELPPHINVCDLYMNDTRIEDFLLLCPDERSPHVDIFIPLEIKLLHAPSGREIVIYSFDNWDTASYIEYRIVRTHPSSDDLTETYYKESVGEYINLIDWYSLESNHYIGWGYINDLGYERCGSIGDLTGAFPRVHIIPSDAPKNAKYTLLGLKLERGIIDRHYQSIYTNPDYQNLIDGAEYAVAPDDEWPDMSDTSDRER